ncbi:hypothetical protein O181_014213 [Austropuccinia psidii MF-1]|uniref:Reverse transcriptase/retrotransposon-derived protein RNase H-like domain-containing protein n=1 Tax=Austropuccinia psidii MF-1 TaxID=1389203 RepID=A0A9Q3C050_9BASI|nr:hypothetical protein [Austropuccinia psidii MF-1]
MQSFVGFASYYRNHIKTLSNITSSLYKLCSKDLVFEITKERRHAYERIKYELKNAPVLILPDFELPFKLFIDAACSQGSGAALHQRQIVVGEQRKRVICYISRQLKDSEARYMLRWQIAIQDYRGNMTIIYKEVKSHTNADGLRRWPLDNVKNNQAYDPEVAAKIPIHFMEIDRKENSTFSEWEPGSGTPDSGNTNSEGTETPILGIRSSELHAE